MIDAVFSPWLIWSFVNYRALSSQPPLLVRALKGQSSEILILFLTYIDRARPEYEPLLILKFFRGPHDFRSKKIFFTQFRRNPFGKIKFFGIFL